MIPFPYPYLEYIGYTLPYPSSPRLPRVVSFIAFLLHLHVPLYIMSKLKWILDKVAIPHEPGLSNAQLMLTNDDLRPGETVLEAGSILLRRPFAGQET